MVVFVYKMKLYQMEEGMPFRLHLITPNRNALLNVVHWHRRVDVGMIMRQSGGGGGGNCH